MRPSLSLPRSDEPERARQVTNPMILWRLRALRRSKEIPEQPSRVLDREITSGYFLRHLWEHVAGGRDAPPAAAAQDKAEALKAELLTQGWTTA